MSFSREPPNNAQAWRISAARSIASTRVIKLLGERFRYVLAASKFKTSETAVRAPERFRAMLLQRREWAQAEGLSADAIEKLYSDLVQHFIAEELKGWKSAQAQSPA